MDYREQMAALFDLLAPDYDTVGVDFFQPIASGLVAALGPRPGERALDVGCGRGAALVPLARAVGPAGTAAGLDVSPRMAELAGAEAARAGVAVDVRVGDAMAPPWPPGSFDVVASSLVLFFLPEPVDALRVWRELLVGGGRVGVSTFGAYDDAWRTTVDATLHAHAPPELVDARTTGAQGPFGSDAGVEGLLREAGYRDVATARATVSPRFDDPEHWYRWSMSVGQRRFWQAVPAEHRDEVRAEVLDAVDGCRPGDGRIGFDQDIRYTSGVR